MSDNKSRLITPESQSITYLLTMNSRFLENYLIRIVMVVLFFVTVFFGIKLIFNAYYHKQLAILSITVKAMDDGFKQDIIQENDPYKLNKLGISLMNSDKNELAYSAFTKATELDPGYRDAWVLKGYDEIKMNNAPEAILSLKKAETIDPIYPLTYELLSIAYENIGDSENAKKAVEKQKYLIEHSD